MIQNSQGEKAYQNIPGMRVEFWLQNQMQEKVCHCKKGDEKVSFDKYTIKFRNKPRGLYFSKALFEGLNFGGAHLWREICVSKSIGLN